MPIYLLVIALFHPLMGVMACLGGAALFALAVLNERLSRAPIEGMQMQLKTSMRFAEQCLTNAEVAYGLGMIEALVQNWNQLSQAVLRNQLQISSASSLLMSVSRFLRQFMQVIMLSIGAWLVIEQKASPGVMIASTILLSRALAPIEAAIAGWKSLVEARSASRRLTEMFAEAQTESAESIKLPAPKGAVSVEQVVFGFQNIDRPVLKQISFSLTPGQALAIVGPSASGKSTLARLLIGIWQPAIGKVRLDGADISSWPRAALSRHIGYLPQDVELFAGTISQNIARMGAIDSPAVIEAAQQAQAHEFILRLPKGYETEVGHGGVYLSGGQRQRIALARALYLNPRFVVLDEPNSNLDAEGEAALIQVIQRLKTQGVTMVVITHRITLLPVIDRILTLRDGVVEKFGLPADVLPPKSVPAMRSTMPPCSTTPQHSAPPLAHAEVNAASLNTNSNAAPSASATRAKTNSNNLVSTIEASDLTNTSAIHNPSIPPNA